MKTRLIVLVCLLSISFVAIIIKLTYIMVINHQWYVERAKMQQIKVAEMPAKRGLIFDRKGRELAINLDTESIICNPADIADNEAPRIAKELSLTLGKDVKAILTKLNSDSRFCWIERKVSSDVANEIKNLKLKGIGLTNEIKRVYPKGSLAAHIIGFVDIDNKGLEGLERFYDKELTAPQEKFLTYKDAKGYLLSSGQMKELKGNNIILTIDEGLQYILEKNLDEAVKKWNASYATAIMMDPFTGEIMAMANSPSFDLNNPGAIKDKKLIKNRAITDCYEPGSTFKIIVGVAALEEGIVKPNAKYDCSAGYIEVGGKKIKDAHRHGVLTFQEVIQKSSNVGTIKIGLSLGKEKLYDYAKRFGFGQKTGIDIAGEVSGVVRPPERWSGISIGAFSIGQEISATPLQILRAYSAIANGGFLVRPYLVSEIRSPDGITIHKTSPKSERIISEKTAKAFSMILTTVTEVGGTAKEASVEGNLVAGKTGTAQKYDPLLKRYSKSNYVSSFVGFVPADNPRFALVVVVHDPRGHIYGGVVAAPVFRKIASDALSYLDVPQDEQRKNHILVTSR
ncbi:MAG: penicillin-binding protein 2 [Thermodesulfovibrionales bacterium]|nr:penicillin-binding protein 2 [Thermodesulfovibrionales bacterium]